jgi:hypothetical protein
MNTISEQTEAALLCAFSDGASIRGAARFAGTCVQTSRRVWRTLDPKPLCKCGRPATHKGWCSARFASSKPRQEFMDRWSGRAWRKHKHTVKVALHTLRNACRKCGNDDGVRNVDKVLVELFGNTDWP